MKTKLLILPLALTVLLALAACREKTPSPPPDLTGDWVQESEDEWYHIATITDDKIEIWWYLPAYHKRNLYWSGTFTPPADGTEPYVWQSTNNYTKEELDSAYSYHRASREETKEFTYKNGVLSYNVTAGHLRLGYSLKKADGAE